MERGKGESMSKTATRIGSSSGHGAYGAEWVVWRLSEPLEGYDHVVTSAVVAPFSGPETYVFGCDADGAINDFTDLDGSFRGSLDHVQAITGAGYEVSA